MTIATTLTPCLATGWYTIFMIVMIPLLGVGWLAYYLWNKKMETIEEEAKKKGSVRLQKTKSEVSDWAKQMAEFKGPPKRTPNQSDAD